MFSRWGAFVYRFRRPIVILSVIVAIAGALLATQTSSALSAGGWLDAPIYHRDALAPGFKAAGPAVIEEYGSTTIVWLGDRFEVGELHEIRIYCAGN